MFNNIRSEVWLLEDQSRVPPDNGILLAGQCQLISILAGPISSNTFAGRTNLLGGMHAAYFQEDNG